MRLWTKICVIAGGEAFLVLQELSTQLVGGNWVSALVILNMHCLVVLVWTTCAALFTAAVWTGSIGLSVSADSLKALLYCL